MPLGLIQRTSGAVVRSVPLDIEADGGLAAAEAEAAEAGAEVLLGMGFAVGGLVAGAGYGMWEASQSFSKGAYVGDPNLGVVYKVKPPPGGFDLYEPMFEAPVDDGGSSVGARRPIPVEDFYAGLLGDPSLFEDPDLGMADVQVSLTDPDAGALVDAHLPNPDGGSVGPSSVSVPLSLSSRLDRSALWFRKNLQSGGKRRRKFLRN